MCTSFGFLSLLKRGWPQLGQRTLKSEGRNTNASQPTQPWSWSTTALAFSSNVRSFFCTCFASCFDVILCAMIGLSASSIVTSVLVVHPLVRCAALSSCHNVPLFWLPSQTPSPEPEDAITRDGRPSFFSNLMTPRGVCHRWVFKRILKIKVF